MNNFRFSSRIFSSFALVLFATLVLLGCGETGSGTDFDSLNLSQLSSDSGDDYITIIEKKSSSSSASEYCVTIGGRYLDCDNVQSMNRVSSSSVAYKKNDKYSPKGYYLDTRDNHLYRTVELEKLTWFAENVNLDGNEYFDAAEALYACPAGTHLPTEKEWSIILGFYTEPEIEESGLYYHYVGTALKSTESWLGRDNGTNELMFDAKANGYMLDDELYFVGLQANFWTSTYVSKDSVKSILITANDHYAAIVNKQKAYKLSVRCVLDKSGVSSSSSSFSSSSSSSTKTEEPKESSSSVAYSGEIVPSGTYSCSEYNCVTDTFLQRSVTYKEVLDVRDSNVYKVVLNGRLAWLAQNLNYETSGSICGKGTDDQVTNCDTYGRMYDWAEAENACIEGWRVPTRDEVNALFGKMESAELGMGFAPAGYYDVDGAYQNQNYSSYFWTSSTYQSYTEKLLYAGQYRVTTGWTNMFALSQKSFMSLHCVKEMDDYEPISSTSREGEVVPAGTFDCEEEECVDRSALDASVSYNEFKDPRDSKVYSVFAIERLNDKNEKYNMYWLAQNLDYNADGSACAFADEDDISCEKYGRMYYLGLANKVCPEGWRLPTTDEIKFLNYAKVAVSLFGFKPNGEFNPTKETYVSDDQQYARFWTSTTSEKSSGLANLFVYDFNNDVISFESITYKSYYLPVRCVMDSQTESNP